MTVQRSTDPAVVLRGGLSVPLSALRTLWGLEDRGVTVRLRADGRLVVSPRSRLAPDDDAAIREHRDQLALLVAYVETGGTQ